MKITIRKCIPNDYAALHALNENEMGYSYANIIYYTPL